MEEMLYKFIDEGKREHEEMRAFICEFRTTNEILFKERNNSLSELRFEVQELLKVINNTPMTNYEIKGVTTRGGKTTTHDVQTNSTNVHTEEPLVVNHDKPIESNKVLDKDQPQTTNEPVIQTSNEEQTPSIPFPQRLRKEKEEAQQRKFLENLKQLHINLPFIEALAQMPKYAKFLKGLLTNKARFEKACTIIVNERCSTVLLNKLPSKEKDPESFTIPYDIGQLHINNALADLGASISLMSYTMYEKLGLREPKATRMSLELVDRSIQYPRGIIENVLIKVDKFVLPIDFVILDMPDDSRVPIILGRPFLRTARATIDVFNKKITLRVGDDEVIFDVDQSIKKPPADDDECYGVDDLDNILNAEAQELLANDRPDSFLLKELEKSIDQSDLESCESLENKSNNESDLRIPIRRIKSINMPYLVEKRKARPDGIKSEHLYSASANEIDEKRPELKSLPNHLEYAYLQGDKSFPIIISSKLFEKEKKLLLQVLEKHKGAIAWKMPDIKGISPSFCTHKILIKDDFKPVIQPQRRLNPKVQDVEKMRSLSYLIPG
ncbi:DNA-directed DNA polymerase [Tanacetum coccineum]